MKPGGEKTRMKTLLSDRIKSLVPKALRLKWHIGCLRCGAVEDGYAVVEGENYCIDCWPGYDCCAFPSCNHYQCEHYDEGCGNAGCDCPGYMEHYSVLSDSGHASRSAYYALSEMPNVIDVKYRVDVTVHVTTKLNVYSYDARRAVYEEQSKLMEEHPNVLFDFHVTHGISEDE